MSEGNQPPPSYQDSMAPPRGVANYGSQQPPQGYYDPNKAGYQQPAYPAAGQQPIPSYNQTAVLVQPRPQIIIVGGCPACRVGVLEDDFTCAGVCCAILFFPIGILCCLAMRQRRCPNCGAVFGS